MPLFEYKGIAPSSKNVSGVVDAESERAARAKLRKQRIFPTKILPHGTGFKNVRLFNRIKVEDIASVTRQLSVLLSAGIPLVDSLEAVQDQAEHPTLRKAFTEIKDKVSEGARLGDCMQSYPKIFDNIFIHMVKAGEAAGSLDIVLERLASFKEAQAELKATVKSAMTYPIIMVIISIAMLGYLFTSVVPKITQVIIKQKTVLPLPTQIVMGITDVVLGYWWLIGLGIFLLILMFLAWKKKPNGRLKVDEWKLHAPVFGELNIKIAVARFARTLSTLLSSGVQLLPGLEIVKSILNNMVLAKVIEEVMLNVKEGESLAEPLTRSGRFPNMFLHMVRIGEKTGQLEAMLERVANTYDKEVDNYIKGMTSLLTPVMLVFMGAMIALIVAAVLLPILQISG